MHREALRARQGGEGLLRGGGRRLWSRNGRAIRIAIPFSLHERLRERGCSDEYTRPAYRDDDDDGSSPGAALHLLAAAAAAGSSTSQRPRSALIHRIHYNHCLDEARGNDSPMPVRRVCVPRSSFLSARCARPLSSPLAPAPSRDIGLQEQENRWRSTGAELQLENISAPVSCSE